MTAPATRAVAATRNSVAAAAAQVTPCADAGAESATTTPASPTTATTQTTTPGSDGSTPSSGTTGSGADARTPSPTTLAFTGLDTRPLLDAAAIFLASGALLLFYARRPRASGRRGFGAVVLAALVTDQSGATVHTAATCTPAAVLPESPLALLLPLAALVISGVAFTMVRRRVANAGASGTTT